MKRVRSLGFLAVAMLIGALLALPASAGATGTWTITGDMNSVRGQSTVTLLLNGKVLVAGGYGNAYDATSSAELYDPATGTWTLTGPMAGARYGHAAALLPDGRVLVAGGSNGSSALNSAEVYNPTQGTWTQTDSMGTARRMPTLTLLGGDKVLVAGGHDDTPSTLNSAELYDVATSTWAATGAMNDPRSAHTATLLFDGTVLVVGGYGAEIFSTALSSAERYDPGSGEWSTVGSLAAARFNHTATLLPDHTVLVAGGADSVDGVAALAVAERYDPISKAWSPAASLATARVWHTATLLGDGRVLVAGGSENFSDALGAAELYDPASDAWSFAGSLTTARFSHGAALLPTGTVLLAGGRGGSPSVTLDGAELYTPDLAVLVQSLTAQYSDCTSLEATVTPAGRRGALAFLVNGSTLGLLGKPSYDATSGAGCQCYRVWQPAGDYPITARFSPEDTATVCSGEATLTVTPEAMTVTPDPRNPTSLAVPWVGKPSGPFVLKASFAQQADGCYGAIAGTLVTCTLTVPPSQAPRAGSRAGQAISYSRSVRLGGLPGPGAVTAAFAFKDIPACTYTVRFSVDNGYYSGAAEGAQLIVTPPPLAWSRWVEPSATSCKAGSTIKVAFLLKYGVSDATATLLVKNSAGAVILRAPFSWDAASGQYRYPGGLVTTGWIKGNYTLTAAVDGLAPQTKTIRLK